MGSSSVRYSSSDAPCSTLGGGFGPIGQAISDTLHLSRRPDFHRLAVHLIGPADLKPLAHKVGVDHRLGTSFGGTAERRTLRRRPSVT